MAVKPPAAVEILGLLAALLMAAQGRGKILYAGKAACESTVRND